MVFEPSKRSDVAPFRVMEVLKAAAARQLSHGDLIALCVGQPSTPAPSPVREALHDALEHQILGYTETAGTLALRAAVAGHYRDWYGIDLHPDEVIATTGSSGGFAALFVTAFEAGDTVAMTNPGYPAYRNTMLALGLNVELIQCDATVGYRLTVDMLDALPTKPKGLIVASPANPTGTITPHEDFAAITRWCAEHDVLLISDEIYHGITFTEKAHTAREFTDNCAVIGSWSKHFSMAGWRLGWLLLPESLRARTDLLLGNFTICPPVPAQAAGAAAFSLEATRQLTAHVDRYRRNRDYLVDRLPELGITEFAPPEGAFYVWCDVSHLTNDSTRWCQDVLNATGVALAPGVDFDTRDGHRFIRFSVCGDTEQLAEACDRLAKYLHRK